MWGFFRNFYHFSTIFPTIFPLLTAIFPPFSGDFCHSVPDFFPNFFYFSFHFSTQNFKNFGNSGNFEAFKEFLSFSPQFSLRFPLFSLQFLLFSPRFPPCCPQFFPKFWIFPPKSLEFCESQVPTWRGCSLRRCGSLRTLFPGWLVTLVTGCLKMDAVCRMGSVVFRSGLPWRRGKKKKQEKIRKI